MPIKIPLDQLRRASDMRTETVRWRLAKARRTGEPIEDCEHLKMHAESFKAGAEAMRAAIRAELDALQLRERQENKVLAQTGALVPFPIPGAEQRFSEWPTGGTGLYRHSEDQPKP